MHSVRFELTHPKISELESDALDHSATNALCHNFPLNLAGIACSAATKKNVEK